MSKEGAARLGIEVGVGYGAKVDEILLQLQYGLASVSRMTRKDFLALAWACVDQASTHKDQHLSAVILGMIEEMNDSEAEGVAEPEVRLSKDEERVLLEMPMAMVRLEDARIVGSLEDKGLIVLRMGALRVSEYQLTELGAGVKQMAGAT